MKKYILLIMGLLILLFTFNAFGVQIAHLAGFGGPGWIPYEDDNAVWAILMKGDGTSMEVNITGGTAHTQTTGEPTFPPSSTTVPSGYSGTSRDMTAADSLIMWASDSLATDISGANQEMSACIWLNFDTDTGADQDIMKKWDASGQWQYRFYYDDSADEIVFSLSSNGTLITSALSGTGKTLDTFVHWCAVYDDTDIRIYRNGVLDSNGTDNPKTYSAGIFDGTGAFRMFGSGGHFDGLVDEPIMFDRALTAAEVGIIHTWGITGDKGASDSDDWFLQENGFEDATADSAWTLAGNAGSDMDYSTSGLDLEGSECCQSGPGDDLMINHVIQTNDVYISVGIRFDDTIENSEYVLMPQDSGHNASGYVRLVASTMEYQVQSGGGTWSTGTTSGIADGTTSYIMMRLRMGTGTNAIADAWLWNGSAWTDKITSSNGTGTLRAKRFKIDNSATPEILYFDNYKESAYPISDPTTDTP